ncbi:MAG: ribonuclease HII [Acidaminococcaceae bacterium]
MKIAEIKELLGSQPSVETLATLACDKRKGVKQLLATYHKRLAAVVTEKQRFQTLLRYETIYWEQGFSYVAGVDEAGRGPLAGPLVVAAVILPPGVFIAGLNDSKQVTASKRETLYREIMEQAVAITVSIVAVEEIDCYNIYQATKLYMTKVLQALTPQPQAALIDAMPVTVAMPTEVIIHGDSLSASIAAASIIAKVTRDRLMCTLDSLYPQYHFAQNKGYGSAQHLTALETYGATPWHRHSYEPVKSFQLQIPTAGTSQIIILKSNSES